MKVLVKQKLALFWKATDVNILDLTTEELKEYKL